MRRVLLALTIMGLVTGAAYAQDLSSGVLIAHHPTGLAYSTDAPTGGWCAAGAIQSCDGQLNDNLPLGGTNWVWYVIAAFLEPTQWCGIEFGLQYAAGSPSITGFAYCVPSLGLEIAGAGWPNPGTGTSVVTTDVAWTGNFKPVYYFWGYSYYTAGLLQLGDNPSTPGPTAFANCSQEEFPADQYGAIGFGMPGVDACPEAPMPWACCLPSGACIMVLEPDCVAQGGIWYDGQTCAQVVCAQPEWACCLYNGECVLTETEADCTAQGGVWYQGLLCGQVTCPVPDVCCVDHLCYFVHQDECTTLGGVWHPEFTDCTDNPCEELTPADNTSWSTIKAIYR